MALRPQSPVQELAPLVRALRWSAALAALILAAPSARADASESGACDDFYDTARRVVQAQVDDPADAWILGGVRIPHEHRLFKTYHFGPYQRIARLTTESAEALPPRIVAGWNGIVELWNRPDELLARMDEAVELVNAERATRPGLSAERALASVRGRLQAEHGFAVETIVMDGIVDSARWHEILREGRMTRDPDGRHSIHQHGDEGQHTHSNQWLLILLDMRRNPQRYGGPEHPRGGELYRAMGDEKIIRAQFPRAAPYHLHPELDQANPWFHLFDHIGERGRGDLPNAANPFYFLELWQRRTGFDRAW